MAHYNVPTDRGADWLFELFGFGPEYRHTTNHTTFSAELHVCCLREVKEGGMVYVTSRLPDFDEKRFHFCQEPYHEDGRLSATGEGPGLHIGLNGPRVAPMPESVIAAVRAVHRAHQVLPWPARAGCTIMTRRGVDTPGRSFAAVAVPQAVRSRS
ncbi:MAG: thioesterase [Rhodobacteraceae bacterium]|nr:thioesterase [Paracoccaceae bacterium]